MQRWLLPLASIAVALVLAEVTARAFVADVYLQRRTRTGGVIVPYEPGGVAELLTDEFRVGYEINRFGYRDRLDRREERTPGKPRIGLLGDSFAAGWGVEFGETFGARLERATGIEVVNAAKNGGCPIWFIPQARYVGERFRPDWLLVQLFDNDPDDNTQHMNRFHLEVGDRVGELPFELEPPHTFGRWVAYEFDRMVLRRRFRQLVRRLKGRRLRRTPYVVSGGRPDVEVLTREESIVAHEVDLSADRPWQGPFSFHDPSQHEAWRDRIAWNAQLIEQMLEEAEAAQRPVAFVYIPAYPVFLRELSTNLFADSSREVAERRGAVWMDGRELFRSHEKPWELYYAHDGHLNAHGHAVVSDALIRELAPRILSGQSGTRG